MLLSDIVSVHSVGLGERDEVRKTVGIISLLNCSSFGLMTARACLQYWSIVLSNSASSNLVL